MSDTIGPSYSSLWSSSVAPATLIAYNKHLKKFLSYTRLRLSQLLRLSPSRIDTRFVAFLNHLHRTRGSYSYGSQALYGLIFHCPKLKLQLPCSKRALKGWNRIRTQPSHPPLTWELTIMIALTFARRGLHAHATASLLAFECYLRVGEHLRLRYQDVVMPNDPRLGSAHTKMCLRLVRTKTGMNKWATIRCPVVAAAMQLYLSSRTFAPDDLIFPFSMYQWRTQLRSITVDLGLGHIPFVPHSFRHGGATRDAMRGLSLEEIRLHGRWKSPISCERYIQSGPAMLMMNSIPAALMNQAYHFEPQVIACLRHLHATVPAEHLSQRRRVYFA